MPCHSTPWRSHLVYPGLRARALTCEPPLHTQPGTKERDGYIDEADRFYADPPYFLAREVWSVGGSSAGGGIPRYVVGFEGIEDHLLRFLDGRNGPGAALGVELRRVWEGWNGFFNEDSRRRGRLVVWKTETPADTLNTGGSL
jgi:phosphatidylinositol glycan class B